MLFTAAVVATATAAQPLLAQEISPLFFGLNLPTKNGTSGTGAFLPGIYNFSYPPEQLSKMKTLGFNSIRIPVNIDTV